MVCVELDAGAQACTLREEDKMLQLKDALDNLSSTCPEFMNLHIGVILLRYDGLLLSEIAHTLEDEVGPAARDLDIQLLAQRIHVAADLLKVNARHMDDAGEVEVRDLNILDIRVEELEEVVRHCRLLRVLHANPQFVRVGRGEIQGQIVIVPHGLDQLEKVDHVHSEHVLRGAEIGLEAIRMQPQIDKHCVCLIYRHDLDPLGIKLEVGLRQNLLQCLNKSAKSTGLYSLYLKKIAVGICVGAGQ